jgi:hypothetical protein
VRARLNKNLLGRGSQLTDDCFWQFSEVGLRLPLSVVGDGSEAAFAATPSASTSRHATGCCTEVTSFLFLRGNRKFHLAPI